LCPFDAERVTDIPIKKEGNVPFKGFLEEDTDRDVTDPTVLDSSTDARQPTELFFNFNFDG